MSGRVVLVGAGPGAPDLLTLRAARELARAEVLLYDALIPASILALASPHSERIDVGKRGDGTKGFPQDEIARLMIERARAGRYVVRLKGGDPCVFGRGAEEAGALADAGVPFEIVPGISSALGVPAYAGVPLTDRRLSSSLAVVTGHRGKARRDERNDWEGLARSAETLVVLMGTAWLDDIVARVIAGGRDPSTPACVIAEGTTGRQRTVSAPLESLAARVREAGLRAPTVVVIGEVVRLRETLAWYERRPLFGRRVLVLRALEQGGGLVEALARAGAQPVSVPLLELVAGEDAPLAAAFGAAADYGWIVFTSANAVRFSAPHLDAHPGARGPRIACVGPATAAEARAAGFAVDLVPEGRADADALARALAARHPLAGARVLLPRSELARDALPRALAAAGARVDCVVAYRNAVPSDAGPELRKALAAGVDGVLLTSPSTVERLAALLGPDGLRSLAERARLACIGSTTAAALCDAGIATAVVAERQTSEGLVEALERSYAEG